MNKDLGSLPWTLTAVWPYAPILQNSLETGQPLQGIFPPIPARVPGCVQADLLRAGLISHPYRKMNSLDCEWVENRWWVYETAFPFSRRPGMRYVLSCAGIDYACLIYLNDVLVAQGEGMFLPIRADVTEQLLSETENRLRIVLLDAPKEIGLGYTSQVRTQKSRFSYKWDFSTRLVHLGIWDEICLEESGPAKITETSVTSDYDGASDTGVIRVAARSDTPCTWEFSLYWGRERLFCRRSASGRTVFHVRRPHLWEIGTGQIQPLYRVEICALHQNAVSDALSCKTGIRRLRFLPNEGAPADAPPYTVELNHRRRYLKGVNMVPLDQMYGCLNEQDYERFCRSLVRTNVNLVRVWGGGLVEKEAFYRWCDRLGILVWQEFIQSSSGVENVPPTTASFLRLLRRTAAAALKVKRNHTCTAIYCGGNELRQYADSDRPATTENRNLAMLEQLVKRLDPGRLFLPTSAYGPEEYVTAGSADSHWDIHGTWKYEGVTGHYALYNRSRALFHSEFGADGMSSPDAIRWILDDPCAKLQSMDESAVWRFHGEWWDTSQRDAALFGPADTLAQAVARSQLIQAEAVRYPVEANRRRAFRNSGSIVWQFNEPWPNISCTSLTEHGGKPKLAYHFLRNSYAPMAVTLQYDTICPVSGEPVAYQTAYVGDLPLPQDYTIQFTLRDSAGQVLLNQQVLDRQVLTFPAPCTADCLYFITVTLRNGQTQIHENTYFFSTDPGPFPLQKLMAPVVPPEVRIDNGQTVVTNRSDRVALYIHQDDCGVFTLFPGGSSIFDGEHRGFCAINQSPEEEDIRKQ